MLRTLVATLLLAVAAAAQNAITTFSSGQNPAGWTFGANSFIDTHVGATTNWFLHTTNLDTFAPQLRTTGAAGAYAGNWRTKGYTSAGVDLRTYGTQFPFARPLSLILHSGAQSVYFLGSDLVPQVAEGWKSFDFSVPSASTTLPAGWAVLAGGAPDATWNAVITNVTQVTFFYGDPTNFFIFDIWNVAADNLRASVVPPFSDLGHALVGTLGVPELSGKGQLLPDTDMYLYLANVPLSPTLLHLVLGIDQLDAPFKGGVLVPDPLVILPTAQPAGVAWYAYFIWPAGLPAGTELLAQVWFADAAGPSGFAATNGLMLTAP